MEKKLIQQVVIPSFVTAIAIVLSLLLAAKQHYGSPTFRTSIETFLIFILPLFPLIYGYITRDKVGAILMGVMPFWGLFSVILLGESDFSISSVRWLTRAIPFWLVLIIIAGLEGYFASKRKISSLFVAIGLYILWILWLLSGIH
ncbi:hypothetical protein DRN97_05880 [Methanosarcinales archaeon]|nr:MAG: hypothetical protein DRN97_05880 [Methanosarcinales archaeon]